MKINKESKLFGGFAKLLDENAPTLCTVGSIACLVATVYFAYKAAKDTSYYQDEIKFGEMHINSSDKTDEEKEKEIKSLKVKNAIEIVCSNRWALLSAGGAAAFAFASNYLNGRKIAGLVTALALSEDKLKKGMAKAKEVLNSEEYQKIINGTRQELARDNEDKAPFDEDSIWDGTEYYDTYVGHFIKLPETQLLDAINTAERLSFIKWNDWRGMLGYESSNIRVGWGNKNRFKAHIGRMEWINGKYVKTIEYDNMPVPLG